MPHRILKTARVENNNKRRAHYTHICVCLSVQVETKNLATNLCAPCMLRIRETNWKYIEVNRNGLMFNELVDAMQKMNCYSSCIFKTDSEKGLEKSNTNTYQQTASSALSVEFGDGSGKFFNVSWYIREHSSYLFCTCSIHGACRRKSMEFEWMRNEKGKVNVKCSLWYW